MKFNYTATEATGFSPIGNIISQIMGQLKEKQCPVCDALHYSDAPCQDNDLHNKRLQDFLQDRNERPLIIISATTC